MLGFPCALPERSNFLASTIGLLGGDPHRGFRMLSGGSADGQHLALHKIIRYAPKCPGACPSSVLGLTDKSSPRLRPWI